MTETPNDNKNIPIPHPLDNARRHLSDLVAQTANEDLDTTTIADEMAKSLRGDSKLATYTDANFWCYNPGTGTYEIVREVDLRNVLLDLQQVARNHRSPFRITGRTAQSIVKTMADRLSDPDFFREARAGVGVPNGFLSIDQGRAELEDKNASNRARLFVPIPYDPAADTTDIDLFMNDAFVESELIDLAFEFAGVALFGQGTKYQTTCILIGSGANGKGVFTQIVERLIPPSMRSAVSPVEWPNDYQRHKLAGSVLNTVGELPPLTYALWQYMKGIIAGDLTTARAVGGNQFELKPIALHIFSTNRLPTVTEVTEAIRRRFRVIPMRNTIPPEKQQTNLVSVIIERNGAGLLRRVVEGIDRVIEHDSIANPEPCQIEMDHWLNGFDPIREFMAECLDITRDPADRIQTQEMFAVAVDHAKKSGQRPPSSPRELASGLKSHGLERTKSSIMFWFGVRFKDGQVDQDEGGLGGLAL